MLRTQKTHAGIRRNETPNIERAIIMRRRLISIAAILTGFITIGLAFATRSNSSMATGDPTPTLVDLPTETPEIALPSPVPTDATIPFKPRWPTGVPFHTAGPPTVIATAAVPPTP